MPPFRTTFALAVLLAVGSYATARPESMQELVQRYQSTLMARGSAGYAAQREVLEALADRRSPEARAKLEEFLESYGRGDRRRAVELLGALVRHGTPRDIDSVIRWIERSRDPFLVELVPIVLGRIEAPAGRRYVRSDLLKKATPTMKAQIARALGTSDDAACVLPLMRLLQEQTLRVRVEALLALGQLGDSRARVPIELFLRNEDRRVRAAAAQALGLMKDRASVDALIRLLDDEDALVVESAGESLGLIDDPKAIPALIQALQKTYEDNLRLADVFTDALRAISGKAIAPDPELWQAWWTVVKDRPLIKVDEKAAANSVPGARYYGFPVRSSKVIFVLDISRSMGWNHRLDMAQAEITRTLETLPRTTRFNIIVYSDRAHPWKSKLTSAKSGSVSSAVSFVRRQKPDNGTNTHEALQAAFRDPDADTIFLLSDGHPSVGAVVDPELIRIAVQDWNRFRRMRLHCIALMRGDPPPAYAGRENPDRATEFLKALATDNQGWFKDVR